MKNGEKQHHQEEQTNVQREESYLWIAEPEVQAAEVGEEAEASEENPVLETGNKQVGEGEVK